MVFLTQRVHLFPFRTQKLSSVVAKILGWRRPGKIAKRQHNADLAHLVERDLAKVEVAGSSPVIRSNKWADRFGLPILIGRHSQVVRHESAKL